MHVHNAKLPINFFRFSTPLFECVCVSSARVSHAACQTKNKSAFLSPAQCIVCVLVRARNTSILPLAHIESKQKGFFPLICAKSCWLVCRSFSTSFDTQNIVFAPLFGACFCSALGWHMRAARKQPEKKLHYIEINGRDMNFKFSLALAFCDVARRALARAKSATNNKAAHVSLVVGVNGIQ